MNQTQVLMQTNVELNFCQQMSYCKVYFKWIEIFANCKVQLAIEYLEQIVTLQVRNALELPNAYWFKSCVESVNVMYDDDDDAVREGCGKQPTKPIRADL